MKKLAVACAVIGAMCFSSSSLALAAENISITVKDKQLHSDSAPIIVQGRVLVPLRAVSEALGASVDWNQQTQTASISKWSQKASLTVGQRAAIVSYGFNDLSTIFLDVSIKTHNNRVYVPLRFISEQLGYKVTYKNSAVSIQSPLDQAQRAKLYSSDLATSRQMVIKASYNERHYAHMPLQTLHPYQDYGTEFLFPEGEALRFFTIEGGETVTLFEYEDDFLVATWQANVEEIDVNVIQQLFEDRLKNRTGPTPKINKPFFYYNDNPFGGSTTKESGWYDADGHYTRTGYKRGYAGGEITDVFGTISFVMPNEVRNETLEIPKN